MIHSDGPYFISDNNLYLLFFLLSLARGLSVLSIFSENHLLVSRISPIDFLFSVSLISALIFIISFLLLTLDVICSLLCQSQPIDGDALS